jgi:hypothetical protein
VQGAGQQVDQQRPVDAEQRLVGGPLTPAGQRAVGLGHHAPASQQFERGHELAPVADAVGDGDRLLGGVRPDLVDQRGDEDLLAHPRREQRPAGQGEQHVGAGGERRVARPTAGRAHRSGRGQRRLD